MPFIQAWARGLSTFNYSFMGTMIMHGAATTPMTMSTTMGSTSSKWRVSTPCMGAISQGLLPEAPSIIQRYLQGHGLHNHIQQRDQCTINGIIFVKGFITSSMFNQRGRAQSKQPWAPSLSKWASPNCTSSPKADPIKGLQRVLQGLPRHLLHGHMQGHQLQRHDYHGHHHPYINLGALWPLQGSQYRPRYCSYWRVLSSSYYQGCHQLQSINNLPLCHWWQQLMLPLRACSHLNLSPFGINGKGWPQLHLIMTSLQATPPINMHH